MFLLHKLGVWPPVWDPAFLLLLYFSIVTIFLVPCTKGPCTHGCGSLHSRTVMNASRKVTGMQGSERVYNWLCVRSHMACLMLLRATDALAQSSSGKDSSGNTALFYANAGLDLLSESDGPSCHTISEVCRVRICLNNIQADTCLLLYYVAWGGRRVT